MRGQVALVAGASKGIGAATAEAFAAAGAAVVLGARDTGALQAVARRIEASGGRGIAVRPHGAGVEAMRHLVEEAPAAYRRPPPAVHNTTHRPPPPPPPAPPPPEGHPAEAP